MALSKERVMDLLTEEIKTTVSKQQGALRERGASFNGVMGLVRRFITQRGRWEYLNHVIKSGAGDIGTVSALKQKIEQLPTQRGL